MSVLQMAEKVKSPPPSVIEDEDLSGCLAAATEVLFHELQKRLLELQTASAPPRRRNAYDIFTWTVISTSWKISLR